MSDELATLAGRFTPEELAAQRGRGRADEVLPKPGDAVAGTGEMTGTAAMPKSRATHAVPWATRECITPALAQAYMNRNLHNRRMSRRHVSDLVGAMLRHEWVETGDAICFSSADVLLNGQHRLAAIEQSGLAQWMFVVRDLAPEAIFGMGDAFVRNPGQVLDILGEALPDRISSAAKLLFTYRQSGHFSGRDHPTARQTVQLVEQEPDLRLAVVSASALSRDVRIRPALLSVLYHLTALCDGDDAETFWAAVASGLDHTDPYEPAYQLRQWLASPAASVGRGHTRTNLHGAIALKAWNAFRDDRSVRRLRWTRSGPQAEVFPTPK